jgi:hypothetical protein
MLQEIILIEEKDLCCASIIDFLRQRKRENRRAEELEDKKNQ